MLGGGVLGWKGVCSLGRGGGIPACTDRCNDMCKNITFATSLRTVNYVVIHNSDFSVVLSARPGNPSDDVIGDTYFYSTCCIFNKVITFYTHFYNLSTWRVTFAHLGRTPLHQTI